MLIKKIIKTTPIREEKVSWSSVKRKSHWITRFRPKFAKILLLAGWSLRCQKKWCIIFLINIIHYNMRTGAWIPTVLSIKSWRKRKIQFMVHESFTSSVLSSIKYVLCFFFKRSYEEDCTESNFSVENDILAYDVSITIVFYTTKPRKLYTASPYKLL